jgi:PleD family two-component response regulator
MNADAVATRMSVLSRALPSRILIVDDDELELELMTDRVRAAGFEVAFASNGQQALALLDQQWYPLLITDWQMPVMDGIALTEALRSRGIVDTYIIMLTARGASVDYERGYISGVDDYLTKHVPDAELLARISAGFNTLALRRSLKAANDALEQSVTIDAESGAFAMREVYSKLHGEIARAQRYGRQLAVMTFGVRAVDRVTKEAVALPAELLREVAQTIEGSLRAYVDWIGRLDVKVGDAFTVVLPETGMGEAPIIKERVLSALRRWAESAQDLELAFSVGAAALERGADRDAPVVGAAEMLDVAEHCRPCPGRAGPEQLGAVQRSVACHLSIACRHGYVVDGECTLKGRPLAARGSDPTEAAAG